jgi:hypothetical protein
MTSSISAPENKRLIAVIGSKLFALAITAATSSHFLRVDEPDHGVRADIADSN